MTGGNEGGVGRVRRQGKEAKGNVDEQYDGMDEWMG